MSDLIALLSWWIVLQVLGLAVLPLTMRVLPNIPDLGFAFARPVGLLLVGFLFWHGATFGLLSNTAASIIGTTVVVAILSWTLGWREAVGLRAFLRERRALVIANELLFTAAFLGWVWIRAHDPDITATEKPMELLFLNGVLRSEQFPPLDPWLSGFSISYYYFGYLMAGMLARVAAVPGHVAFNLMLPTLFALTATGAFAIGAALQTGARAAAVSARRAISVGLLAAGLVLAASNLEPVLEILNANRMLSPEAHAFFAIKDMPPGYQTPGFFPSDNWWWFRATRVVGTAAVEGRGKALDYTINEFPAFSFVLGDMHPHVLALPFVFLALALALNLLRAPRSPSLAQLRRDPWTVLPIGLVFGGLGFLNTWDMPTGLFVLAGAFTINRLLARGVVDRALVREVIYGFVGALTLSIVLYLPFYLVFRSQAQGLGLVVTKTRLVHFALFWGPTYLLVSSFLLWSLTSTWRATPAGSWTRSIPIWVGTLVLSIAAIALEAPVVGLTLPLLIAALAAASRHLLAPPMSVMSAGGESRRSGAATAGVPGREPAEIAGGAVPLALPREGLFALLLAFTGLLLLLGCEIVYIRDFFQDRMNTVFKLYYQAWIVLALAGSYALPLLLDRIRQSVGAQRAAGYGWAVVVASLFAVTLLYPVGAILDKTRGFAATPTLDGTAFWGRIRPEEMAAINWLRGNVSGAPVIVEATGGSYRQEFGRVASMTGLPTLLGWDYHEQQWRGSYDEQGRRKPDIEQIYRSNDSRQVLSLLSRYGATYLFVGQTERDLYGRQGVNLERFAQFMDIAYRNGQVTIYRVRERSQ